MDTSTLEARPAGEVVIGEDGDYPADPTLPELDVDEAHALTQQLRSTLEVAWVLVVRAWEGKVWRPMGYKNWKEYVDGELPASAGSAYRLLDRAMLITQIQKVAPPGTDIRISERAAVDLRAIASQVVEDVSGRLVGAIDPLAAASLIDEVVASHRADLDAKRAERAANRPTSAPSSGNWSPPEVDEAAVRRTAIAAVELCSALASLSSMPAAAEVVRSIPADRASQISAALPAALRFLTEFNDEWDARP